MDLYWLENPEQVTFDSDGRIVSYVNSEGNASSFEGLADAIAQADRDLEERRKRLDGES